MAKTSGIGSGSKTGMVTNVGYNSNNNQYYSMPKKNKNTQIAQLRSGEILQGRILEIINDKLAKVGLPIGNFNALLHGKLKQGDSLFFLVKALEPSLTLQVHSVSSKQKGNLLPVEEALRMLDIPDNELYVKITSWILKHESKVTREDVLLTAAAMKELPAESLKGKHIDSVIKLIFNHIHSDDELPVDTFEKLFPLFKKLDEHEDKFDTIVNQILKTRHPKVYNDLTKISNIKTYSGVINLNNHSQINDILDVLLTPEEYSKLNDAAKKSVAEFSDLVNAVAMWNTMAAQNNLTMYYFLPIMWAGTFYAALISLKKQRHKQRYKKGRDESESELLEFDDSLKLTGLLGNFLDGKGDLRSFLSNFATQLRQRLFSLNYDMNSFKFSIDGSEEEMLNNNSPNSPINFSVVV